jgi:hypothetical protein
MGKKRGNNRTRSDKTDRVTREKDCSTKAEHPKVEVYKSELPTFRSVLGGSSADKTIGSTEPPIRSSEDSTVVDEHNPIREEIRAFIPIPHVSTNRECRLVKRRNDPYHYALWRDAYDSYLRILFDGTQNILNSFKVPMEEEISFETFSFFIYEFSSGDISPYV